MGPPYTGMVWMVRAVDTLLWYESRATLYWYGLEGQGC